MTQAPKGGETLDTKMSAKELASYEWKGMRDGEDRALFEGSESIKVTVGAGSEQKTWYLPKNVLTHCSPFFDAALNGNFVEARSKLVDLPEDDPDAFETWAIWLSLGKLEGCFGGVRSEDDYMRAWKLGDKLACPAFKDHVMSQFLVCFEAGGDLWLDTVQVVYGFSSPGSKLRRWYVDWFVWNKLNNNMEKDVEDYVIFLRELPEFSDDVVRREVMAGRDITRSPLEQKHRYYENPAFNPDA